MILVYGGGSGGRIKTPMHRGRHQLLFVVAVKSIQNGWVTKIYKITQLQRVIAKNTEAEKKTNYPINCANDPHSLRGKVVDCV